MSGQLVVNMFYDLKTHALDRSDNHAERPAAKRQKRDPSDSLVRSCIGSVHGKMAAAARATHVGSYACANILLTEALAELDALTVTLTNLSAANASTTSSVNHPIAVVNHDATSEANASEANTNGVANDCEYAATIARLKSMLLHLRGNAAFSQRSWTMAIADYTSAFATHRNANSLYNRAVSC